MNEKFKKYVAIIREKLDDYRFEHSLAVAEKAEELAQKFGADKEKAYLAGLLHDITKNFSKDEQLQFFGSSAIMLSNVEKASPKVWHAISGATYIKNVLKIEDSEIINAVRYHTTGREDMSLLEKIVYIADFTSKDRNYPDVDILREKVNDNLDDGIVYALRHTIHSLSQKNQAIHPDTLSAYNQLLCEGMFYETDRNIRNSG